MNLTKPKYTKAELLDRSATKSTTFNNWHVRGIIPFKELGVERVSLSKFRYSGLVMAYLICLNYHTGTSRKLYVKTLKQLFKQIARQSEFNTELVVAIDGWGKGKDCGVFKSQQAAMTLASRQCAYVPVGLIIQRFTEDDNE